MSTVFAIIFGVYTFFLYVSILKKLFLEPRPY
jgi:hypothetical protein